MVKRIESNAERSSHGPSTPRAGTLKSARRKPARYDRDDKLGARSDDWCKFGSQGDDW